MSRGVTVRYSQAVSRAKEKVRSQARFAVAAEVWGKMNLALGVVLNETPAWSGNTLANYVWGIGGRSRDYSPVNQNYSWRAPIFPVRDPQSYMAISRANLNAMRSEVFKDPFRKFVLYNNVQYEDGMDIRDLEYGDLTGEPALMFTKAKAMLEASNV